MAYSTPAQSTGNFTTSGVGSFAISFVSAVTAGNLVVVCISLGANGSNTGITVSDNKGNTYSQAVLSGETAANDQTAIYYSITTTGGTGFQVTVTPSVNSFIDFSISEWAGGASSAILDGHNSNFGQSGTSVTTGSVTPSVANDLIVVCMNDDTSQAGITDPSGFSVIYNQDSNTTEALHSLYKVLSGGSGVAQSATWTLPASDHWSACIAIFKPGAAAPSISYDWLPTTVTPIRPPTSSVPW